MSESRVKHTPAPWAFVAKLSGSENHKGFFVRAEKANRAGLWALADVQPGDEDGKVGEANARLIAAAPDLLYALREVRPYVGHNEHALVVIDAAIRKAQGEQQ